MNRDEEEIDWAEFDQLAHDYSSSEEDNSSDSSSSSDDSSGSQSSDPMEDVKPSVTESKPATSTSSSENEQLFEPYCALGLVTDGKHLSGHTMNDSYYLTVTVDTHIFMLINTQHLAFMMGPSSGSQHIGKINALVRRCARTLFVARGFYIELWDHNTPSKPLAIFTNHLKPVTLLTYFGSTLVSISEDRHMITWQIEGISVGEDIDIREVKYISLSNEASDIDIKQHGSLDLAKFADFSPTFVYHPNAYINKILVGGSAGTVLLINTNTQKCIYKFKFLPNPETNVTPTELSVVCIAQSPVPDVCAFSLSDGSIFLHNLKLDVTLFKFQESLSIAVSLAFRTDPTPVLISGNNQGFLSVWDLEDKELLFSMEAHKKALTQIICPLGTNSMYTIGKDNSLQHWMFDQPDGKCRIVMKREGHFEPITTLSTLSLDSYENLMTGSEDQDLRAFPVPRNQSFLHTYDYSRTFSYMSSLKKKATKLHMRIEDLKPPRVIGIDSAIARIKDWGSVVTWHHQYPYVYVWHFQKLTVLHRIKSSEKELNPVTSAVTSPCGNFFVLGTSSGWIERFNIQSGTSSGTYFDPSLKTSAHTEVITGLQIDAITKFLISASTENQLKVWSFHKQELLFTLPLTAGITRMELFRENNLLAVATDDHKLSVFDYENKKLSRQLPVSAQISCFTFSPDGRWIVLSTVDSIVYVYDIPSAKVIDWFRVEKPISCIRFLPKGDFLATVFAGSNYFHLWANQTYWRKIFLKKLPPSPPLVYTNQNPLILSDSVKPSASPKIIYDLQVEPSETSKKIKKESKSAELSQQILHGEWERDSEAPLDFYLHTKSSVPKAKWSNIHHLDTIKKRNKPIEPPKKGKTSPFFLELIEDLNPHFDPNATKEEEIRQPQSKFQFDITSPFSVALVNGKETKDYQKAFNVLKSLNPSGIDYEISSIPDSHLDTFLEMIHQQLDLHQNFELFQAYLGLFLKRQGEALMKNSSAIQVAQQLLDALKKEWPLLEGSYQKNLSMIKYFSGIQF